MEIVAGTAPEALEELPAPTHAFIGGSSGNLKEIVRLLLKKNPQVRMVLNCITLETVGEAMECIRELEGRMLLFPGKQRLSSWQFPGQNQWDAIT